MPINILLVALYRGPVLFNTSDKMKLVLCKLITQAQQTVGPPMFFRSRRSPAGVFTRWLATVRNS